MQRFRGVEHAVASRRDVGDAGVHSLAHRFETDFFLGLATFHQPETLAQYFTRVLITTGRHEPRDKGRLMVGKDDVPCGNDRILRECSVGILCHHCRCAQPWKSLPRAERIAALAAMPDSHRTTMPRLEILSVKRPQRARAR